MIHDVLFQSGDRDLCVVRVRICVDLQPLPFPANPPHSMYTPCLAVLGSGTNSHGSLNTHYYACTDSDSDPSRLILWAGTTGSQEEDSIGRLVPAAWIDFEDQASEWDIHSWYDTSLQSALLSTALASWLVKEWVDYSGELKNSDVLTDVQLSSCWDEAVRLSHELGA